MHIRDIYHVASGGHATDKEEDLMEYRLKSRRKAREKTRGFGMRMEGIEEEEDDWELLCQQSLDAWKVRPTRKCLHSTHDYSRPIYLHSILMGDQDIECEM